ncbi:uncharacterized protein LOC133822463 [Humulus lupulus]|uniref:uncharacterized protein LOC133822463 n=1 Tax=Humulus lupulus TaxID=3486 RepID=UPI002B41356B|nr:uncharacterized protein LOC133822463 [Humulus lupulus]
MDSEDPNLELVNVAIQKLKEERRIKEIARDDDDELLLSRLLSQLESLKGESNLEQQEALKELGEGDNDIDEEIKSETSNESDSNGSSDIMDKEEIVKELKKVKKQNRVTHWLLSTMIVLTIAWQISELSILLKIKEGFNHPFKSLGGMLTWVLKGPGGTIGNNNGKDEENHNNQTEFEAPSLPPLKIPELPHVELPDLTTTSNHEEH